MDGCFQSAPPPAQLSARGTRDEETRDEETRDECPSGAALPQRLSERKSHFNPVV